MMPEKFRKSLAEAIGKAYAFRTLGPKWSAKHEKAASWQLWTAEAEAAHATIRAALQEAQAEAARQLEAKRGQK